MTLLVRADNKSRGRAPARRVNEPGRSASLLRNAHLGVDFEYPALLMAKELVFSVTRKDLVIKTFQAGGPGGQHQNHNNTAVRITHPASGAAGEARDSRSQHQNMKAALHRMVASKKFETWKNRMLWNNPEPAEKRAERDMHPSNLLIMGRSDGKWKIID